MAAPLFALTGTVQTAATKVGMPAPGLGAMLDHLGATDQSPLRTFSSFDAAFVETMVGALCVPGPMADDGSGGLTPGPPVPASFFGQAAVKQFFTEVGRAFVPLAPQVPQPASGSSGPVLTPGGAADKPPCANEDTAIQLAPTPPSHSRSCREISPTSTCPYNVPVTAEPTTMERYILAGAYRRYLTKAYWAGERSAVAPCQQP